MSEVKDKARLRVRVMVRGDGKADTKVLKERTLAVFLVIRRSAYAATVMATKLSSC